MRGLLYIYILLDGQDTMGIGYMAEQDEGAIGADLAIGAEGAEGAEGAMGSEGVIGAEEDKGAAIYLMLDSQDTTGIGYIAL